MPVIIAVTVAEDFSACQAATIYILKGLKELFRENEYRTQYCNAVTENDIGKKVRAAGWVENIRDHGGIMFVDLRDHYGVVQVVFHNEKLLEGIHKECAVSIAGTVLKRDESTYNDKIETGTVEIEAEEVRILGKVTEQLPFEVATSRETREDVRLKYRYLDLRNKKMHDNIVLRSKIISFLRNKMSSMGPEVRIAQGSVKATRYRAGGSQPGMLYRPAGSRQGIRQRQGLYAVNVFRVPVQTGIAQAAERCGRPGQDRHQEF